MRTALRTGMPLTIILFGVVSLFADIAGEMLFPILPLFLKYELGISAAALGIIEGVADGVSDLFQVWAGWLSDRLKRRKIFVVAGYSIAALGKLFLALAATWPFVFIARLFDRGGKGIRTSPRDAMLAETIVETRRGWAFGFHRTMDSGGAVIGNILAAVFLALGFKLRSIVWIALIPAVLAIFFLIPVREKRDAASDGAVYTEGRDGAAMKAKVKVQMPSWRHFFADRREFGDEFWRFIWVSVLFHFGKISYLFLLLRAAGLGINYAALPLLYLVFNIIQTALSLPAGKMADGFGKAILVFAGFVAFAGMSAGFAIGGGLVTTLWLFVLCGVSFAFMEVGVRAFAVELSPPHLKGTGLGIFFTMTGLALVISGFIAGWLWDRVGPAMTFWFSAGMTGLAAVLFLALFYRRIGGAFRRLAE